MLRSEGLGGTIRQMKDDWSSTAEQTRGHPAICFAHSLRVAALERG